MLEGAEREGIEKTRAEAGESESDAKGHATLHAVT